MDTALANGDFQLDSNGRPKQIGGVQELLQRAMIRLNVPLGSFAYDTALGSRLQTLVQMKHMRRADRQFKPILSNSRLVSL